VLRRSTRLPALAAYLFTLGAAIAGTLMFYFRLSSLAYLKHLSANLKLALQPGRDADPSVLNPASASFLNLQAFLARFSQNPHFYNNLAYAVVLALVILLAFSCWRNQNFATRPFTIVSVLVMLELLVTYHRQYDHMMILAALPGMFEVKKKSMAIYIAILLSLCAYHFSQLHGKWLHGWGPAPLGPPIEVLMALLWIHSLWGVRAARQSHANEKLAASV
jgi:branched-subunit amino acid transport protein AzlD